MLFEQIRSGGCLSYVVECDDSCAAMIVDPYLDQRQMGYTPTVAVDGGYNHWVAAGLPTEA